MTMQIDKQGRFVKGRVAWNKGKTTTKVISPIDISREQFLQIQPQFFEHPLGKKTLNIFMFGDHHYLNDRLQKRPQKMINIKPTLKFLKDHRPWDVIIFGGDTWDLDYLSHWNSNKFEDIGHNRIDEYVNQEAKDIHNLIKLVKETSQAKAIYYFEGNHECLNEDTELLTKRGWVLYSNIKYNDKALSFNPKNQCAEWVNIDHKFKKYFKGELNIHQSTQIDLCATDDHKIFFKSRATQQYCYTPIKLLNNTRHEIPVAGYSANIEYKAISDDMIKLCAWILTDGHIKNNYKYISIYQAHGKHKIIEDLLLKLNLKVKKIIRHRKILYICNKKIIKQKTQYVYNLGVKNSKKILKYLNCGKNPPSWINSLSQRQFTIFLDTLILGDGSRHKSAPDTSLMLYGKKEFLNQIQQLCVQFGYGTSLSVYRIKQYRLNICPRIFYSVDNMKFKKYSYSGNVWDLTVKNHNFMVRRNGKAYFTGNSWLGQYQEKHQKLNKQTLDQWLRLDELGVAFIPVHGVLKVGKNIAIRHGECYRTENPAKQSIVKSHRTNFMFHWHKLIVWPGYSDADVLEKLQAYCLPGMCNVCTMEFMKNSPNNWSCGFLRLHVKPSGHFTPCVVPISPSGNFIYDGVEYAI